MLPYNNYTQKLALLKEGKLSLTENVQYFLDAIEEKKRLNVYNFVFGDESLQRAAELEKKIAAGNAGKLAGMVIAIKDVLALEGKPLTCSSKILDNFTALYTATAVQRLLDEDAVIIGKTNCDEFAMGSSNENSAFGPALNPVNEEYVTGGSSGGSAAAVAANLCDVSLGTDTGGSIRQPASFCGVCGVKPTYARVSRFGLTAFASSFDSIGPFSSNVEDSARVLEVIAGHDDQDSTSSPQPVPSYTTELESDASALSVGLPKEYFGDGLNEEIKQAVEQFVEKLKAGGVTVKEVSLPHTEYAIATYYILTTAEASSNLARYDGARYGKRSEDAPNLVDMYTHSRSEGFGTEVKRRIMLGTYVLSAGYYDAYYRKAQKARRIIQEDFIKAFNEVDILLTPTSPTTAFKLGEKTDNPLEMYLSDIYTTSTNLAGVPGINLPLTTDSAGLPIGVQLMAERFEELKLLQFARFLEKEFLT